MCNEVVGATAYGAPATWYIGLFTASPGVGGSAANEVSGGSYNRVAVTNNTTNFPTTSTGSKTNATAITFPTSTASWGTVTYVGLCASGTPATNDVRAFGTITSTVIGSGVTPSFAIGALTVGVA